MIYVGIDNGLNGGIVAINDSQEIIFQLVMPTIKVKGKNEFDVKVITDAFKYLMQKDKLKAVLEQAHVRPISGKRASFTTGFCYGLMQGVLETHQISYEIVSPREWQKEILKGMGKDTKAASILYCQRKWPKETWCKTDRSTKPHDGLTDACCMAVYCFRKNR